MGGARINTVKDVLTKKVTEMAKTHPNRKMGIVLFESQVHILGDGSKEAHMFHSADFNVVEKTGISSSALIEMSLEFSEQKLLKKIAELRSMGSTQLGPGLLVSIALASTGSAGSSVIMCTDGAGDDESMYGRIAEYAAQKGVLVNMMFIEGAESNIQALSRIAEATDGDVMRVNCSNMEENMSNFLAKKVLAT